MQLSSPSRPCGAYRSSRTTVQTVCSGCVNNGPCNYVHGRIALCPSSNHAPYAAALLSSASSSAVPAGPSAFPCPSPSAPGTTASAAGAATSPLVDVAASVPTDALSATAAAAAAAATSTGTAGGGAATAPAAAAAAATPASLPLGLFHGTVPGAGSPVVPGDLGSGEVCRMLGDGMLLRRRALDGRPAGPGLAGRAAPVGAGLAGRAAPPGAGLEGRTARPGAGLEGRAAPPGAGLAGRALRAAGPGDAGRTDPRFGAGLAGRPPGAGLAGRKDRVGVDVAVGSAALPVAAGGVGMPPPVLLRTAEPRGADSGRRMGEARAEPGRSPGVVAPGAPGGCVAMRLYCSLSSWDTAWGCHSGSATLLRHTRVRRTAGKRRKRAPNPTPMRQGACRQSLHGPRWHGAGPGGTVQPPERNSCWHLCHIQPTANLPAPSAGPRCGPAGA